MAREFAKDFYQSKAWKDVRDFVFNRDFGICQVCGKSAKIVHHVIWITEQNINDVNVTLNPINLILVCKFCHDRIHSSIEDNGISFDEQGNIIQVADTTMSKIQEIRARNKR